MSRAFWFLFGFLSSSVGLYPLLYFFIDRKFGLLNTKTEIILSNFSWNFFFYPHIVFGGIALLLGWTQFSNKIRTQHKKTHRQIGKIYVFAVLLSGISGIYIALYATGGWISSLGFLALGLIWLYSTAMAFRSIKKGELHLHQKMMIYSYAACFAAVTLRIWLPILAGLMGEFIPAYRIVAWFCWVPNIILAYFLNRRIASPVLKA